MIDIPPHFRRDDHGIWSIPSPSPVSYPEHGSQACYGLEERSYWFQHRLEILSSLFRRFQPSGTVLDVGGGNGVVTRRLLQEGYQAALLEPSAAGCQNARLLRAIDLVLRSTLEEAALPDGCADAVGLFDVLEHIADDRACLTEIHRVLKPGGRLFLTVPAFPFLWSANDPAAGHYKRYTRASLARVLDGLFHIEFSSYLFACLLPPLFLLRSLPYRLRLTRRALLDESAEHGTTENTLVRLIRHLLERERHRLQQGKTLPFGTSCVVVARRV